MRRCAAACSPALLFAAEFFCIFIGLQYTSASRMVVFIYIAPFVVALGMPLIARVRAAAAASQAAGLLLAFAGVAWAFAEGFSRPAVGPRQWIGDGARRARRHALGRDDAGHPWLAR